MKTKAFTLIEVMVVMAIISILAGMMAPAVWKFWESEEIATTRERMREIKKGLVGDKSLVQNGVRTHYGFVGDNGELPKFTNISSGELSYLVSKPVGGYPNWNGPYLSGFGSDWDKDAWGKAFQFKFSPLSLDAHGRYVSAELRSAGPDGIFGTSDDIVDADVQISDREVTPTNRIQGNFLLGFTNSSSMALAIPYGTRIKISFRDVIGGGDSTVTTGCKSFTISLAAGESRQPTFRNFTTLLTTAGVPLKLPVGQITMQEQFFKTAECTDPPVESDIMAFFISDGLQIVNINLPAIYATVP
jgi:prepilin-type N-terminal cleavage/methylation domain-containing protein